MLVARVALAPSTGGRTTAIVVACVCGLGVAGYSSWVALRGVASSALEASSKGQASAAPGPRDHDGIAIRATDLRAVDPADLITQAGIEVRKRAQNCELVYAYIGTLTAGVLDATGYTSLLSWGCHRVDPTKPPGQDMIDDEWDVRVSQGKLELSSSAMNRYNRPPWNEPRCPFSQAWQAAVASGIPSNAVVSVYYRDSPDARFQGATVWAISVAGHPEFDRNVDGATCKVLR